MTDPDYQRIWDAAYAAAFVADFEQFDRGKPSYYQFDDCARRISGIRAEAIANLAVKKLKESRGIK